MSRKKLINWKFYQTINKITDGKFKYTGGIWDGMVGEMGPSVLVSYKQINIIISSFGTYEWNYILILDNQFFQAMARETNQ